MQAVETVIGLQAVLALMIAAGILGKRSGIITEGFFGGLSKIIVNLLLPCGILNALSSSADTDILIQSVQILLITVGIHFFYIFLAAVLCRHYPPSRKPVFKFGILCPNTNFMGIPIIGGLYGETGIVLLSVALLPARIFINTVGISYFAPNKSQQRASCLIKNPCIWATILGLALLLLGIDIPDTLQEAMSSFSACTTPLSMILIGGVVGKLQKKTFSDFAVWRFCLYRLLLIPTVVLGVIYLLPVDSVTAATVITMSALPAGALTVAYTQEYQKDTEFAAACVVFSTLLSIITVPIIILLCSALL